MNKLKNSGQTESDTFPNKDVVFRRVSNMLDHNGPRNRLPRGQLCNNNFTPFQQFRSNTIPIVLPEYSDMFPTKFTKHYKTDATQLYVAIFRVFCDLSHPQTQLQFRSLPSDGKKHVCFGGHSNSTLFGRENMKGPLMFLHSAQLGFVQRHRPRSAPDAVLTFMS